MSMDSPDTRPEPRPRALDTRRRLRLFAITLWTAFLGAVLTLAVGISLLPHGVMLGWSDMSVAFLAAWAVGLVPVALALMLALPPARAPGDADGR